MMTLKKLQESLDEILLKNVNEEGQFRDYDILGQRIYKIWFL